MEELRKLEEVQRTLTLLQSRGISTTSSNEDCSCFVSKLTLLLVQPCGELDLEKKCSLVSEYMPKISATIFDEACNRLNGKGYEENYVENALLLDFGHKPESGQLQTNSEEIAMVGLDAMQRANSTLEDFCRSYFMFHGMDINKPQSVFQYLPMLSFTESYIYQLDNLNEKTVEASSSEMTILERGTEAESHGKISQFSNVFETDPFRPLECLFECHGLLTKRMQDEFKSGEEYWALERKLCYALKNKMQISVDDAIKAIHLKSFDYRVLNLLLYQLRGEKINELHMEFLSVSEFLVEVADDLFDYEEDVLENNFNILRMFVRIYGASAPTVLAKYITEAEEKYNQVLKALDPQLSLHYQRRCVEATKEVYSSFLVLFDEECALHIDDEMERHSELLKETQDNPTDVNAIVARRRKDFTEEFFRHLNLLSEVYDGLEDRDAMARLGARCLSAVSAYDNTLEYVDTLDTAQAKFDDILNSPSIDVACEKIKSLAKAKELDSSLVLLINSGWFSAKESTTMKNEVKDIMYHLYKATKSSLRSIVPKEIKLLKHLLNITDPEERFSALATAFCPDDDNEAKDPKAVYTTPKELHKWIKIMLDAYHLNVEETDLREAKQMTQPVVIQRLFILKETIEEEYLEQSTSPDSQTEDTKSVDS